MSDLVDFLLKAKRGTYASQGEGGERVRSADGGRELGYREGAWEYHDLYYGTNPFCGRELVRRDGELIWAMTYYGCVTDQQSSPEDVYRFLKAAMMNVAADRPFRGPANYVHGEWSYRDSSEGTVDMFSGTEIISHAGRDVYELRYSGGRMRGV